MRCPGRRPSHPWPAEKEEQRMSPALQDEPAPVGPSSAPSGIAENAEQIAAAVSAAPGVASLSGGRLGGVGPAGPGRRIAGVVAREHELGAPVAGPYGVPVSETAAAVRRAAEPF